MRRGYGIDRSMAVRWAEPRVRWAFDEGRSVAELATDRRESWARIRRQAAMAI